MISLLFASNNSVSYQQDDELNSGVNAVLFSHIMPLLFINNQVAVPRLYGT